MDTVSIHYKAGVNILQFKLSDNPVIILKLWNDLAMEIFNRGTRCVDTFFVIR